MANIPISEDPKFNSKVRKFETEDDAHADLFNAVVEVLVNNDAFLQKMAEQLAKAIEAKADKTAIPATGICSTARGTAAKTVDCPGFTLYDGVRIMVTFENGSNTNYMTLDVNGTGGVTAFFPINGNRAYNNEAISRIIVAGCAYEFIFQDAVEEKDKKWVYCGETGFRMMPEDIGAVSNDQVIIGTIDNGIASENLASYGISANNTVEEIFHMLPRCSITCITSNVQTNIFANSLPVSKGCLALYKDSGGTRGWAEFHKYDDTMVYYAKFHDEKMSAWSTNYLPLNGNAVSATKLATTRSIFGQNFDGTSNVAGKGVFNGKYNASPSGRFTTSALEIRENGLVEDSQTDIGYAPTIAFHWSNTAAGTLALGSDKKFYFITQFGNRATIDANLSGNAIYDGNGNIIVDTYLPKQEKKLRLEGIGWHRIAKYSGGSRAAALGTYANGSEIIIKREYTTQEGEGEYHRLELAVSYGRSKIKELTSFSEHLYITKARHVIKDKEAYIDVYYNGDSYNNAYIIISNGRDIGCEWIVADGVIVAEDDYDKKFSEIVLDTNV